MRIIVQPADDGHDMQSNWEVTGRGKTTSHTRKSAAKNEADRRAHDGDTKVYKSTAGQILETRTHNASAGGSGDAKGGGNVGIPGMETFHTGISDVFK